MQSKEEEGGPMIKSVRDEVTNGDGSLDPYISAIRHCVGSFDFR